MFPEDRLPVAQVVDVITIAVPPRLRPEPLHEPEAAEVQEQEK
jgi:hypothetical protein